MRKLMIVLAVLTMLTGSAGAFDLTAPEVPSSGRQRMPEQTQHFGEAVLEIVGDALGAFRPDLREAVSSCGAVLAGCMALALVSFVPGHQKGISELVGVLLIGWLLLRSASSMIALGAQTVAELSDYGKLLLPVMTAALAAQGGVTAAAAIYMGTAVFDTLLSAFISDILVPTIYLFLALAVGSAAVDDTMLKKLRDGVRRLSEWSLKTILYIYTGYISITGVVSGTADAGILKAAKLTISGAVPVVGGILSDASEAVLVSAGTVKNAAGTYGMLAILAVWIGPFLRIGAHYLILKALGAVCSVFGIKSINGLLGDFATAMGLLLAMTGSVCLMLVISTVCYMKGVGV